MARLGPARFLIGFLVVGLVCVLPACGVLGDNGDDGDDEKFPEPPERPGSAHVAPSDVDPLERPVANGKDGSALSIQVSRPVS